MSNPVGKFNPTRAPYPGDCANDIFNTGCAAAMQTACSGGNTSNDTSQFRSDLLNPQTNCYSWKIQYENAYYFDTEGMSTLISFLDQTKRDFCASSFGQSAPECLCLTFPTVNAQQCNAQSTAQRDCPQNDAGNPNGQNLCYGRDFTRNNQGGINVDGTIISDPFIEFSFAKCVPYYCWVEPCLSTGTQLLTSDIIYATTFNSVCGDGICLSVIGTQDIGTNQKYADLQPPISSNYTPAFEIFPPCGGGAAPAQPTYVPTTYTYPVDNAVDIPVAVSNNGSFLVQMTLLGTNQKWISMPQTLTIAPISASRIFTTVNSSQLLAAYNQASQNGVYPTVSTIIPNTPGQFIPAGFLAAPTFTYTYYDGFQPTPQTFTMNLSFNLTPPIGKTQPTVSKPKISTATYIFVGVCAAILLLALFFSWKTDSQILELRESIAEEYVGGKILQKQVAQIKALQQPSNPTIV